jgi:ABC-type sugar transport system ATPase subunit
MVFQDYALFPHLDVYHNIAYGLQSRKKSRSEIKFRVTELLELVQLSGYEHRRIDELSGGEKQRVALARAIAPEPDLLLFDEPLSALDVKLRKDLRREIKRIQRELGFTAIYVTHDQEEAMSISDRISVMNEGRICQSGAPEELYNNPIDYFTADFIGIMNKTGDIMFRPESCQPVSASEGGSLSIIIETCEYTGGRWICEGKTAGNELITFYSSSLILEGKKLSLRIDENKIIKCC